MELSVHSPDNRKIVEVGWTVESAQFGDTRPHLFVFRWVDGTSSAHCYNSCGFVPLPAPIMAGAPVQPGTIANYGIEHREDKWVVTYNHEPIGYYPDSIWGDQFKRIGFAKVFGEVATTSMAPCTDMGNGNFGHVSQAATFSRFSFLGSASKPELTIDSTRTNDAYYDAQLVSPNEVRIGGPGAC
jgi:hypothetical protein